MCRLWAAHQFLDFWAFLRYVTEIRSARDPGKIEQVGLGGAAAVVVVQSVALIEWLAGTEIRAGLFALNGGPEVGV
jgi:hypothetical protein